MKPTDIVVSYFINNNLGFSLNVLGDSAEGEIYCRKAIRIDPGRPNGHKNLGIALALQGRYQEAAECFIAATQVNALDSRAFDLLTQLLESHPEIEVGFGDVARRCGEATKQATARNIH
jgi:Flp pilus assembly protein TadD